MSFQKMIKGLKERGLLDADHNLTPEGHQYVEDTKKEYVAKTGMAAKKVQAQEKVIWPIKW